MPGRTKIISRNEVKKLLSIADCISVQEEAFVQSANNLAWNGPSSGIDEKATMAYPMLIRIIFGGIEPNWWGVKMASYGSGGPKDRSRVQIMALFKAQDLCPVALIEWSYMGIVRTGAAAAVATKYLANKDADVIGVLGTGAIARYGLLAHSAMDWPAKNVYVYSRSSKLRDDFVKEMSEKTGYHIESVDDPEYIARNSKIIITGTSSPDPVIMSEWIQPGTHINGLGKETEIDPYLFSTSINIADEVYEATNFGKIGNAIKKGVISLKHVHASLGEVIVGMKQGRENASQITLYDSSGLCFQDVAAAVKIVELAQERGLGYNIEFDYDQKIV